MQQPVWLGAAWRELGQAEVAGRAGNARIEGYYRDAGHPDVKGDEVAWCAAFAGSCLKRSGLQGTGSLMARSYVQWGAPAPADQLGAIAILTRGSNPSLGHVGFLVGWTADRVMLLGGNQGDRVSVEAYDRSRLIALRWPQHLPSNSGDTDAPKQPPSLFDLSLPHILTMEGGFTDDPYDPGGPTNRGITLAVYATVTAQTVTSESKARIVDELKAIPSELVGNIYLTRYWRPSEAGRLPPMLALMHFDAAVNHGVGTAARILQEALGVTIDGEIGPQTLAAANQRSSREITERYGELRRQRYRALPHFWRFGRGWLARVDKTLAAARKLQAAVASGSPLTTSAQRKKETSAMTTTTTTEISTKWWGQSITIWGAAITALSTVVPALAPLVGLSITAELVQQIGQHGVQVVQAIGGLVGTLMTVYGRVRATSRLERRDVTLYL